MMCLLFVMVHSVVNSVCHVENLFVLLILKWKDTFDHLNLYNAKKVHYTSMSTKLSLVEKDVWFEILRKMRDVMQSNLGQDESFTLNYIGQFSPQHEFLCSFLSTIGNCSLNSKRIIL